MNRLLIVANDNTASHSIGLALEIGGMFHASHACSVAEAVAQGGRDATPYDAVLIVTSKPTENVSSMCSRLRQIWTHCPIIIIAQNAREHDIVNGLDAGASDVIVSPYRTGELRARLRAQIRAHANSAALVFQIGPYRFQPATRTLQNVTTGVTTRLTHKETEVLKYLNRSEGVPVARQTLLREVWGYKDGADSYTVESHVYRLRRKLEADPSRPRFLLNEEGGYRLIAEPPRPWPPARPGNGMQLAG